MASLPDVPWTRLANVWLPRLEPNIEGLALSAGLTLPNTEGLAAAGLLVGVPDTGLVASLLLAAPSGVSLDGVVKEKPANGLDLALSAFFSSFSGDTGLAWSRSGSFLSVTTGLVVKVKPPNTLVVAGLAAVVVVVVAAVVGVPNVKPEDAVEAGLPNTGLLVKENLGGDMTGAVVAGVPGLAPPNAVEVAEGPAAALLEGVSNVNSALGVGLGPIEEDGVVKPG